MRFISGLSSKERVHVWHEQVLIIKTNAERTEVWLLKMKSNKLYEHNQAWRWSETHFLLRRGCFCFWASLKDRILLSRSVCKLMVLYCNSAKHYLLFGATDSLSAHSPPVLYHNLPFSQLRTLSASLHMWFYKNEDPLSQRSQAKKSM